MFIHELWSDKFVKMATVPEKSPKIQRNPSRKTANRRILIFEPNRWNFDRKLTFSYAKILMRSRNPAYAINETISHSNISAMMRLKDSRFDWIFVYRTYYWIQRIFKTYHLDFAKITHLSLTKIQVQRNLLFVTNPDPMEIH